jgi:predicted phosphodiesterase
MCRFLSRPLLTLALIAAVVLQLGAQATVPETRADVLRFAVLGDFGTGEMEQYQVAERLSAARQQSPFDLVLALGDNMYGSQTPRDFVTKFERPYARLLEAGVRFQAVLGNHDKPDNRHYPPFNMGGERYYAYTRADVQFVALDSNLMEPRQIEWLDETLANASQSWKIVYLHHPLYSNGRRHGSNIELRVALEPILIRHGVQVVFAGHEHVYERLKPQRGITHFVAGSGGQLRKGNLRASDTTAAAFDQDQAFILVEVSGDELQFRTLSRTGTVVDSGTITRRPTTLGPAGGLP